MNGYRPEENHQCMYVRTVKLLRSASEVAGGDAALAQRLGIGAELLRELMSGQRKLPKGMLLEAVDIILASRESKPSLSDRSSDPVMPAALHRDP